MILIVGLGNLGKKFEKTRHNLGFRIIDQFARNYKFPDFKLSKKFKAEISQGKIANQKIILAKPQTFMNLSGKSVKKLISNIQYPTSNIWVVHDDVDLTLGKIRISKGRGSAGHKGVQSIIEELKTKDFVRFRIGINPKNSTFYAAVQNVDRFVLQKFNKEEEKILKEVIERTCQAVEIAITKGIEKAMQEFNK